MQLTLGHVLRKVAQGLRFIWPEPTYRWPEPTYRVPGASAFVYRRYQLSVQPVKAWFEHLARPITTPQTPGVFAFGLRLMALDGTIEDVPDTPANMAARLAADVVMTDDTDEEPRRLATDHGRVTRTVVMQRVGRCTLHGALLGGYLARQICLSSHKEGALGHLLTHA
jgi:hypothetical protein